MSKMRKEWCKFWLRYYLPETGMSVMDLGFKFDLTTHEVGAIARHLIREGIITKKKLWIEQKLRTYYFGLPLK